MQLTDSLAWIGFTSSTGPAGGDMHGITSFSFEYVSSLSANVSVVSGLVPTQAGALSTFLIQSFDVFQHPYPFGGAAVNVTFLGAQPEQQSFTVTDFQNGTYAVSFNCTNSAVTQMEVTLGGIPIQNSPFAVQIVAGDVDSRFGQFSGANTYARAGTPATVNFLVFDRFLNPTNATCSFANSTLSGTPGSIDLQNPILSATGIWSITYVASKVGGKHFFFFVPFKEKLNTQYRVLLDRCRQRCSVCESGSKCCYMFFFFLH